MPAPKKCSECGLLGHVGTECGPSITSVELRVKMPRTMADEIDALREREGVSRVAFCRRLMIEALSFRELAARPL